LIKTAAVIEGVAISNLQDKLPMPIIFKWATEADMPCVLGAQLGVMGSALTSAEQFDSLEELSPHFSAEFRSHRNIPRQTFFTACAEHASNPLMLAAPTWPDNPVMAG
jgi:hypothetical protein